MGRLFGFGGFLMALAMIPAAFGQGGQGGFGGGLQGREQQNYEGRVAQLEQRISGYLRGEEIKNILTPGEYSEWPLTLKEGDVVIAEARSDAFDPALQIVQGKDTVLFANDDRYPGDQRPLLFWRCEKAGEYFLRARCFHDKSGGQFFLRDSIYPSVDIGVDKAVEGGFLVRVPMKAGQIKQISFLNGKNHRQAGVGVSISPIGLPNVELSNPLQGAIENTVMAPVDGDYYVMASPYGNGTVQAQAVEILPVSLPRVDGSATMNATMNAPTLWSMPVKAGELLELATPELRISDRLVVAEQPDTSKFDMKKPETNPFFPDPKPKQMPGPAFVAMPARARDGRLAVYLIKRDAVLWVASNGDSPTKGAYTLTVKPAAKSFGEGTGQSSRLTIGNTDYWAFDAKVGDVMTLGSRSAGFAQEILVRDPDQGQVFASAALPDQTGIGWNMIVSKPGRYLVSIASIGDGGGGEYSLSRKVFHPKEFSKASPAKGEISADQIQVWRFRATPGEPLLLRWTSTAWSYSIEVRDEHGTQQELPLTVVDGQNQFGILKVQEPTTFTIVLISQGGKSQYSIELDDLPGYGKKGGAISRVKG